MADLIVLARAQQLPTLASVNAAYLANLISAASTAIERYCKRVFGSAAYVSEVYDGNGSTAMFLLNFPITALTSVVVLESDGTTTTLAGTGFDIDAGIGEIRFERDCSTDYCYFPSGFQNLQVNYTAGFATIPADLQEACAQYCAWLYAGSAVMAGVQSEKLGDYAASFGPAAANIIPLQVQKMINPYRSIRP